MAAWLDSFFYPFDYAILHAIHQFALATGGIFTDLVRVISSFGHKGLGFILLGILLLPFKKTRKLGIAMLIAIAIGGLITNITLKPLVSRPRPYTHEVFQPWWQYVGASEEGCRSFPSGHTTTAFACMTALFLTGNKKRTWPALVFAALIGFTRLYLVVHYPTDVIGGLLAGVIAALVAFLLTELAYRALTRHERHPVCHAILAFDLWALLALPKSKRDTATARDEGDGREE